MLSVLAAGTALLLTAAPLAGSATAADRSILLAQATTTEAPAADAAAPAKPAVAAPEAAGSVDVAKLMAEGPLKDIVIGDPKAPVTIVEYASTTCSHCRDFHEETLPTLKKDYIDTGKAKLILREFPFDPRALAAFMLARCTNDDAKRTAMVDILFQQQDQWARAENASVALLGIAKLAGFTQDSFTACLSDKALQQKVVETQQRGETEFGVNATPTFFINGDKYAGALSPEQMAAVIDKHL
ncbi:DsbA family protein [Mangrovicella endophytica]|uniref:DsbA family protein n=1 Tax=Mangrovicella endophytica TaxID=2066697 RepID=UPI000C9E0AA2|nr:DsbA family protein [Mangrovicella endophytica]